jgi:serine/threonine protein kinase/CheY-like chemotaxis protein
MNHVAPVDEAVVGCVLIAEDEDALRKIFARSLRSVGHEVIEAANGKDAVELLPQHAFDAIVTDIRMPDVDGVELLREVHETQPDVPVLLLTGAPALETAMKAVEYRAFEYLTKPVDLARLAASVARAVKQHRATSLRRSAEASGVGSVVGNEYRLGRLIGSGGMGAVYEATRVDRAGIRVAIKVLHPRFSGRADVVARCRREAEVVAALDHPNIVKVLDFGSSADGPTYLVMELLVGRTLASAIARESPLPQGYVVFIAFHVLAALRAAHAAGVVHRDIKPENVFIASSGSVETVKLLDFGIAKLLAPTSDGKLTETGIVLGTPAYMAPEYARGEKPDARSDVYAVGCVIYEALTSREPFTGDNYNAILHAIQEKSPPSIRDLRPDVSPELAAVIEVAMAKDRAARFQSAEAMADALTPLRVLG